MPYGQRSTPAGSHRPVLLEEVLRVLDPAPGAVIVDATAGAGGHSEQILKRVGPTGLLISLDRDADNLPQVTERLTAVGHPFRLHHANFAGIQTVLGIEGVEAVDGLLADLGMSSMQVDDAGRGFSYVRDGPLDMRMDRSRGRSAAQLVATLTEKELATALAELGDEPQAKEIAAAIVAARGTAKLERTVELARLIAETVGAAPVWKLRQGKNRWESHPASRTFQALRLLVNRELDSLQQLLRVLPTCLRPGGKAAIISFHSGEDRLVKTAFRDGERTGIYAETSPEPIRPTYAERTANPRSRSAKLRWARKA